MRTLIIGNSAPVQEFIKQWDDFIHAHPQGNIFQGYDFSRLCFQTPGYEPHTVIALNDEDSVCGIMQGVIIKEPGRFARHLTSRAIAWGGPLAKDDDTAFRLVTEYEQTLGKKVIYSQIRPVGESPMPGVMQRLGFSLQPHLDIVNNLTGGTETMLSAIHKERRRNIGRAKTKGVTVRLTENESEIVEATLLILKLYKRIGLPSPPQQFLYAGKKYLGDALKVFVAEYEGKIVGSRMVLCYRDVIYDWYAGSDPDYHNKYINDLLPWEVMLWASQNGFRIFDFGGAGNPDEKYGVRDFKMRYGGRLIENSRFISVHKPLLMFTGEKGIKVYRAIKKRLK
jgi:serine/alanine adding enzyme